MTRREFVRKVGTTMAVGATVAQMESLGSPQGATLAELLGYRRDDRLLILHADDLGMCHAVIPPPLKA